MQYPGRLIKVGETDARVVKALKTALNKVLVLKGDEALRLDADNPNFGPQMKQAVQLFQARQLDYKGQPLKVDGEVGAITWARLFDPEGVPETAAPAGDFLGKVLEIAAQQEAAKVREEPVNSNRGPKVDKFLSRAGVKPGLAWCCAFVYWCFDEAAIALNRTNPMFKTAGCLAHWNGATSKGAVRILAKAAVDDPSLLRPGMIFIMDYGGGMGHTGLIERVEGGHIVTIEGNTDASKTREGGGVYRLTRKISTVNKGFIDYGPALLP